MNDDIAIVLTDLIKQYGTPLCADRQRLRNLLNDLTPGCTLEVNLLIQAVDQQIPIEVMGLAQSLDVLTATRLAKKITNAYGTSSTNAQWVVRAWAKALGKVATSPVGTNASDPSGANGRTPSAKPISTNGVSSQRRAEPYLEYVKAGDQFAREKDWESAVEAYKEAFRLNPQIIDIYDAEYYQACFECGLVQLNANMFSLAVDNFSEGIRVDAKAANAYFQRGSAYLELEQFDNAIMDFDKAISLNLNTADLCFRRGYAHGKKGNLAKSVADFDEAIRLNSGCGEAYVYRGLIYEFQGKHAEALKDYNEALRINPDNPQTLYHRGLIRSAKGSYKTAVTDFVHAIRLKPDFADAYLQRAIVFVSLGDYEKALDDLNKVIELTPSQGEAYYRRAIIYSQQGEWNKVVDDCSVALDCSAKEPEIICLKRGEAFQALGDLNAALLDYSDAIKRKPDYALAYVQRGQVRQIKNLIDKALEDYDRALALDNVCVEALLHRAEAYKMLKRWNEAAQDYQVVISLWPDWAPAYAEHADLLIAQNPTSNRDSAISDLVKFVELAPEARSNISDTLATLLYQRASEQLAASRYEEAIRDYDTLSHVLPEREQECQSLTARVYVIRGDNAMKSKNYTAALADYIKANHLAASSCEPAKVAQVHVLKGDAALEEGDYTAALADYEAATHLSPAACKPAKFAQVYAAWGDAALKRNDYDTALSYYEKAYRIESTVCPAAKLAQICHTAAEAAFKGKANDNVIRYCQAYLSYAPDPADTVFEWLAESHIASAKEKLQAKDYQVVIAHCDHLIQQDYNDAVAYFYRSQAFLELGKLDEAEADIEVASGKAPEDSQVLHLRAEIKRRCGNIEEAIVSYESALKYNKNLTDAMLNSLREDYYWAKAQMLCESQKTFRVMIIGWNVNGSFGGFGSLRVFIPKKYQAGDIKRTAITICIVEVDRLSDRLIGSEKEAKTLLRNQGLRNLQIGQVYEGQVTGLVDFGAFVEFNKIKGLVHKSEIVCGKKSVDPYNHLTIGQMVRVKVIGIKYDEGKVSLSISQAKQS